MRQLAKQIIEASNNKKPASINAGLPMASQTAALNDDIFTSSPLLSIWRADGF
jgi:hypothetical protein